MPTAAPEPSANEAPPVQRLVSLLRDQKADGHKQVLRYLRGLSNAPLPSRFVDLPAAKIASFLALADILALAASCRAAHLCIFVRRDDGLWKRIAGLVQDLPPRLPKCILRARHPDMRMPLLRWRLHLRQRELVVDFALTVGEFREFCAWLSRADHLRSLTLRTALTEDKVMVLAKALQEQGKVQSLTVLDCRALNLSALVSALKASLETASFAGDGHLSEQQRRSLERVAKTCDRLRSLTLTP